MPRARTCRLTKSSRRGDVALLENLDLHRRAEPGDYELIALPLKIVGSDSSPVRAILRELAP